jgi:hypothetical protein
MTGTGPTWLQIATAFVPIAVALITGTFLLTNTVGRRIERLKSLVEIRKDFPEGFNYDYALERLMFRELWAIDRASTPFYRWYRRGLIAVVATVLPILFVANWPGVFGTVWSWILLVVGITVLAGYLLSLYRLPNELWELDVRHRVRLGALDNLIEQHNKDNENVDSGVQTEPTDSTGDADAS